MSDGRDRKVALKKQSTFSNSFKIAQNNVLVFYFIKLKEYWGNFQSSYETKKSSMEQVMRLLLEELWQIGICRIGICIHFATFFQH